MVQPAVDIIVNMIDSDGLALVNEVPRFVGVPGTNPSTNQVYIDAGVQLDNEAVPANDMIRHVMLNPKQSGGILGTQATQFNPNKDVSEQNRTGSMGMAWGSELSPGVAGAQRARPADAARVADVSERIEDQCWTCRTPRETRGARSETRRARRTKRPP